MPVRPVYGFCALVDVAGTGVTAQAVMVGLLNHRVAVIPGDGLGEVKCADYVRLNYSHPDPACFEPLRAAQPPAIAEAQEGRTRRRSTPFSRGRERPGAGSSADGWPPAGRPPRVRSGPAGTRPGPAFVPGL